MALAICLSGASALIFETVWFRRAGLVFGNSVWATSLVLAAFMAGLGAGNLIVATRRRIDRPLLWFAALEVIAGLAGLALTFVLPTLTVALRPITGPLIDLPWLTGLIQAACAFVLMLVPSTAIGGTLPLAALANSRLVADGGRVLGRLYAWNTCGAVVGVAATEMVLIGSIGVLWTAWSAAALCLVVSVLALWRARHDTTETGNAEVVLPATRSTGRKAAPIARDEGSVLACAFLSGANLMALEVIWLRFLSLFIQNNARSMSIVLGVVLSGMTIGAFAGSAFVRQDPHRTAYVPTIALAAAVATLITYVGFQSLSGTLVAEWHRVVLFGTALTAPTSMLSGLLFVVLCASTPATDDTTRRSMGHFLAWNTLGATVGPLVAALVMLPRFGAEGSLLIVSFAYVALAGVAARHTLRLSRAAGARRSLVAAAVAAATLFALFPYGLSARTYLPRVAATYLANGEQMVAAREGMSETLLLLKSMWMGRTSYYRIVTNGFPMTATELPARRYMSYFAYWPMLLHTGAMHRALVICYGLGVTAGAVERIDGLQSIDIVDTSRDIVAMSDLAYAPAVHPLRDPRVNVHIQDGRYFLQTTEQQFDLITGEPPPLLTPGTVNLYTREYFEVVRDRLSEGGITTYWLPVARPWFEEVRIESIIRAFCDVFEDCSLWHATPVDWMLVGRRHAKGSVTAAQFAAPWSSGRAARDLVDLGFERPELIGTTFLADAEDLNALTRNVPPLTDNYPRRLMLHEPGAPVSDAEVRSRAEFYRMMTDVDRTRHAFERSRFIRELWPPEMVKSSSPYFDVQRVVNGVLASGPDLLAQLDDLDYLLTRTPLRTIPFWILGMGNHLPSDELVSAIAQDDSGSAAHVRGVRALVDRDFQHAAEWLGRAAMKDGGDSRPLFVVALCLAGKCDLAAQVRQPGTPMSGSETAFWRWIDSRFPQPATCCSSRDTRFQ